MNIVNWANIAKHPSDIFVKKSVFTSEDKYDIFPPSYMIFGMPHYVHNILDFGCGIGRNFQYFKQTCGIREVDGYDIKEMIERCKNMQYEIYSDNLYSDWNDVIKNKYDIVYSAFVFQFFDNINDIIHYLIDISKISNLFYYCGQSYICDSSHTPIYKIINSSNKFNIIDYQQTSPSHCHCLYSSKENETKKILINTIGQESFVKWKPTLEKEITKTKNNLVITISFGKNDNEILKYTKSQMEKYAYKIDADFIVLNNKTQEWWGLEKFRIKHYAQFYDRVLYLDSDVYIKDNSPNIFDLVPLGSVGIREDLNDLIASLGSDETHYIRFLHNNYHSLCVLADMEKMEHAYLNTGVIVFGKDTAKIFEPPTFEFKTFHCAEQDIVEQNVRKNKYNIYNLPIEFNSQYWHLKNKDGYKKGYFLHVNGIDFPFKLKVLHRIYNEYNSTEQYDVKPSPTRIVELNRVKRANTILSEILELRRCGDSTFEWYNDSHNCLYGLLDFIKKYEINKNHTIVELGTFDAVSTMLFAYFANKVITVDLYQDRNNDLPKYFNNIILITCDSIDYAKQIDDNSIDVVYIDTLHTFERVQDEITAWLPKVKDNGVISGHDYTEKYWPEVCEAVNTKFTKPDDVFNDSTWAVRKRARNGIEYT